MQPQSSARTPSADPTLAGLADTVATPASNLATLDGVSFSEFAVQLVPEKVARRHLVVPMQVDNRTLTCVTCDPISPDADSDLGFASGRRIKFVIATRAAVLEALDRCYPKLGKLEVFAQRLRAGMAAASDPQLPSETAASRLIEMCNDVIGRAVEFGASDIHIDCGPRGGNIRYRVGGAFESMPAFPVELSQLLFDRFKVMARVAVAVRNRAQSGSFRVTVKGRPTEVYLSSRPALDGEQIVMQLAGNHRAAVAAPRVVTSAKTRLRVLVTDDEPITRMLVKLLLERERFDVIEATNGEQAVELAGRERPDLLLIDLNMPVMDGYQAIHLLRNDARLTTLPIIVLTAEDGQSVERRVLALGANDYLVKPFEPAVLLARVNAVFQRLNMMAA